MEVASVGGVDTTRRFCFGGLAGLLKTAQARDDSRDEFGKPCRLITSIDGEDSFEIKPSTIHGNGTFSRKAFAPGDVIGHAATARHSSQTRLPTDPAVDRTVLGRYVNHSDDPNTDVREVEEGLLHLTALKDIKPGEELTCDYSPALKAQLDCYRKKNSRPEENRHG
jgi:hypothetical protein